MGLVEKREGIKYLQIKKGKFALYNKETKENALFSALEGYITGYSFETKTIENKPTEFLNLNVTDGDDNFIVQVGVNTGYFRAFVNGLRSGDPQKRLCLSPTYQEDGAKKNSSMFVSLAGQGQKAFPWYATKKDMKDVPVGKEITINGQKMIDRTEQNDYWKRWLATVKWASEFEASAVQYPDTNVKTSHVDIHEAKSDVASNNTVTFDDNEESDLPF